MNVPKINFSGCQENPLARKRVAGGSAITFFTKVYLELSRTCNADCRFCRNQTFDDCEYNVENIKNTLGEIKSHVNAVVIGGGEPTLRLEDVKYLYESFPHSKFEWHMFSNGTNPEIINDDYIMDNFKLNISRHAVNDEENASIFRANNKIMLAKDIENLNIRNGKVTLNAVCFKGGLDSLEKIIEYIKFAKEIGCKKVLIQDLQKEMSLGNNLMKSNNLYIDKNLFFKVLEYLKMNDFKEKYPIYATGGYVSYILKNKDGFQVAIQKYISKKELEEKWISAITRTFDLSIAPNGELYEDLGQITSKVKTFKI